MPLSKEQINEVIDVLSHIPDRYTIVITVLIDKEKHDKSNKVR